MSCPDPEKTITLSLRHLDGLWNLDSPLVPAPVHPEVGEALWKQLTSLRTKDIPAILLRVPAVDLHRTAEAAAAVRAFFQSEAGAASEEVREILREGRASLRTGLLISLLFAVLAEGVPRLWGSGIPAFLSSGFIIFAWVALWHPAELLVYAHHPVRKRRELAQRAAQAEVRLETREEG